SVPIYKNVADAVLSGSFCKSGNGFYVAEKVGDESYAARVTSLAKEFKLYLTPLQKKINFIVKALFGVSIILVALKMAFSSRAELASVDFVRELTTIVISLVPQGLVLMSSVTFALGVYRISRLGAIVQKLNAIESFSNVQVVCMDKTGTLTMNQLAVNCVTVIDERYTVEEVETLLGTYGRLSTDRNATLRTLERFLPREDVRLLDEVPFSSEKKMSLIHVAADGREETFILGAFDVLVNRVAPALRERANRLYEENRLGVYRNVLFGKICPDIPFSAIRDDDGIMIEAVCIVSITDEVRGDVMQAIKLFQANGIDFKILSGDAPEAVRAVVREIGWQIREDQAITGEELDRVEDEAFFGVVTEKAIFARLRPDHKLRIIKALRREKIYTAMIGDGVNDLPAIKEADLGIAMEEGSRITKEVADIVLLKNRFSLLPAIFDEGNRIVNTVGSVAKLFLTKNFLVIAYTLLTMFTLFVFPLTPRRVALVNVFTIGLPSFVIALRNSNTARSRRLILDLFSFVTVSALFISGAGVIGEVVLRRFYQIGDGDLQMALLCIIVITSVANFFAVVLHKRERHIRFYALYGVTLLAVFTFLVTTRMEGVVLDVLRAFYEISHLDSRYWGVAAAISLASAALLFLAQKLREKVVNR
ncbi:MAG TPA: HAD-IC family P-type ATPase, partial [Blastocatellia bacterium]|nr:HAD-IC family P-type ATPase [Blastocatellia bacterium]